MPKSSNQYVRRNRRLTRPGPARRRRGQPNARRRRPRESTIAKNKPELSGGHWLRGCSCCSKLHSKQTSKATGPYKRKSDRARHLKELSLTGRGRPRKPALSKSAAESPTPRL